MELMYPIVIIASLLIGIGICILSIKKKTQYKNGIKVANTKYLKETEYYKQKIKEYKRLSYLLMIVSVIIILVTSILVARPVTYTIEEEEAHNRDIIISLDVSLSECEVNLEFIKKFKEIIPDIKGDRIGIVIYNTSPIVYCPLTDDYDYIGDCIDALIEQFQLVQDNDGNVPSSYQTGGIDTYSFWYGGVIANSEERGSSLVGDGLARNNICISRCKNQ